MLQQHAHMDRLSKTLLTILLLTIAAAPAYADTLFNDGFENTTLSPNWIVYQSTTGTNQWASVNTTPHQSGSRHAQVTQPGTSRTVYMQANVSTSGYDNVNVTYWRMLVGLDGPDEFTAEWYDGTTWTAMEATGASTANDATYLQRSFVLPASAAGKTAFAIRFTCLAGAVSEICRVDNVTVYANVTGTVLPPPPPPSSGQFNYTVSNQSGKFNFNLKPHYRAANGSMLPVNNTLVPSNLSGYEYGVTSGIYEAHFKNLPSTTSSVLLRRGVDLSYDPEGLYWDSSSGNDIIDANPNGAGDPDSVQKNLFVYPDAYGAGINLTYEYTAGELKENIIVANRALLGNPSGGVAAGANLSLRADFALHNTNNLDLYVDGVLWTANGIRTNVTSAEFRNSTGTIFKLETPIAYDSNGSSVQGWYNFRRTLGDLWVEQHFPFSWIDNSSRVYPIRLDPSTEVTGINGTVIIDLTDPEYNPLVEITLYNVTEGSGTNVLIVDPVVNDTSGVEQYAIDPSGLNYDYGIVYVSSAQGDLVLKCAEYNITLGTCGQFNNETNWYDETWTLQQQITRGQNYSFIIEGVDPSFYEFSLSDNESTTNTTTFTNKLTQQINISATAPHLIMVRGEVTGSSTTSSVLVRAVLDGTTTFINHTHEPRNADNTQDYQNFFGMIVSNLSAGTHNVTVDYASETGGVVTYIKNVKVSSYNLVDYTLREDIAEQTATSTTLQNRSVATFSVSGNKTYMFLATGEHGDAGQTTATLYAALNIDGTVVDESWYEPKDGTDYPSFMFNYVANMTNGSHYAAIQARKEGGGGSENVRNLRVVAIPVDAYWDVRFEEETVQQFAQSTGGVGESAVQLNFTPTYPGDYLYLASLQVYADAGATSGRAAFIVDGVNQTCTMVMQTQETGRTSDADWLPFVCTVKVNLNNSLHTSEIRWYDIDGATQTWMRGARITAFSLRDNCNPTLNSDWYISQTVVCDNVTRTTGTGRTIIISGGSLELINNAQIYTNGSPQITRWGANPWFIMIQRGSNIYGTH